jgi:hypothetical protein
MTDVPKTVEEWAQRVRESGLSGSVTMVGQDDAGRHAKSVEIDSGVVSEFRSKIPSDMFEHIREILSERDRMVAAVLNNSIDVPAELKTAHLASLRASCLQIAIDILRKKYAERKDDGTAA